jgi:hypothetical protein
MSELRYIVAYMGGKEEEGIEENWIPFDNLVDAVDCVQSMDHDFWKASICQIVETYES